MTRAKIGAKVARKAKKYSLACMKISPAWLFLLRLRFVVVVAAVLVAVLTVLAVAVLSLVVPSVVVAVAGVKLVDDRIESRDGTRYDKDFDKREEF